MDKNNFREKGQAPDIREKPQTEKPKPVKKAAARAMRYKAVETARKQLQEAKAAAVPEDARQDDNAVDQVEDMTALAVQELPRIHAPIKNVFHGETHSLEPDAQPPTPQELMRQEAVREFRERQTHKAERPEPTGGNMFHGETYFPETEGQESSKPNPMRQRAVQVFRERKIKRMEQNVFHCETHFADPSISPSAGARLEARHSGAGLKTRETIQTAETIKGQRQKALPQAASSQRARAFWIREQRRQFARKSAVQAARKEGRAGGRLLQRLGAAVGKTVKAAGGSAVLTGGGFILLLIPLALVLGVAAAMFGSSGNGEYTPVSDEVEAYAPLIQLYAEEHGIPEYTELIKAVMMQESRGLGTDPMQASESPYNTRYPGGITDPEYSIDVGIQSLAYVINMAGVESPIDIDGISLALQGYNYGSGYISWAVGRYGGYSELGAIEYSDMMAERMGWAGYGDKAYVAHVLRYYPVGRIFMPEGSAAMAEIARSQVGNQGGEPYWSWYGCPERVEWCAIFVSWCADQCGCLRDTVPRFDEVARGAEWFRERDQWESRDYEPRPGDIIFFDWEQDGRPDHVGIVSSCDGSTVHTVEGNSGDAVNELSYTVGAATIYGYGVPAY